MASIYLSHQANQLPSDPAEEGRIYPLLRKVDDTHLSWAFAVPRPSDTGQVKERRKNRLVRALLHAMGFKLDTSPNPDHSGFDFLFLEGESLIGAYQTSIFDEDTLPNLSGTPAKLLVLDPDGGTLKLKPDEVTIRIIKETATFGVDRFRFESGDEWRFELQGEGAETNPSITVRVTPDELTKSQIPSGTLPVLSFEQSGLNGALKCNRVDVIASNQMPGSATTIALDIRHDRLTLDVATLVCIDPDTTPKLAIEVFPAISFQPDADLPVTVSLSNDSVCLRLQPRVDAGDNLPPRLTVNRFKPCVRVTIRGPVIHAEASSSGALEALRLLEPAERKFESTVEQINDFLVYSFEVCLPTDRIPQIDLPHLLSVEAIGVDLPNWPVSFPDPGVFVPEYLLRLAMPSLGLRVPDYQVNPLEIDLRPCGLPFADFLATFGLPDISAPNWPRWKDFLRFRKVTGVLLPGVDITGMSLDGLTLKVTFASIPVDAKLELHLPDKISWSQFDIQFPEVGIPSLTEFELGLEEPDPDFHFEVTLPVTDFAPNLPELWRIQLKKPSGPKLSLKITEVKITGSLVQFKVENLPEIDLNADKLLVNWRFRFTVPNPSKPDVVLNVPLPQVRLPKIDDVFDVRLLKLRAFKAGIEFGSFGVLAIAADLKTVTLDIPPVNGRFPIVQLFKRFEGEIDFEISLDVSLSLSKCFLSGLLGDLASVNFRVSVPSLARLPDFEIPNLNDIPLNFDFSALSLHYSVPKLLVSFGSLSTPIIPLELIVRVPHPTRLETEWDEIKLVLGMKFDVGKLRLADNRIYFFLPQRRSSDPLLNFAPRQVMDFDIFTLTFPNRPEPLGFPTADNHDGYLDLTSREFVIDLRYPEAENPTPPPRIHAFFPGGMNPEAARLGREGVENLKNGKEEDKDKYSRLRKEYTKRFDLELDEVDPKLWPNTGPDRLMFRFNSDGLTFAANLGKTDVEIDSSGFMDDGSSDSQSNGLIKPFKCQPQDKQRELRSRIVIIDNELKEAGVYAKSEVPGVDKLMAEISVVLRQRQKGMLPEVVASMELERADDAPLAEFSIKLLEMSLDRLALGLIWRMEEKEWDYSIVADGTIAFTGAASLVPDLEGLRAPSMQVVGLDLRRMNLRQLRIPIDLVKPVKFDILDGMFGVELGDMEIGWEFEGGIPKPRLLACEMAKLTYKNPGALEVSVTVGGFQIEFDEDLKAHVKLPSSLGIEVALGSSAKFAGRVGWVETDVERYLFASGKLMLEGLPEIRGLLKFGTGLKNSGRREINLVLYGEMDLDEQLFSGAVVKSLGLGVGLNNRLSAIPASPSADAILRRIDQVNPGELEGWQFVREGGFYLSVVGSVTLASNLGEPDVLNAYVAALVVSIDTNFDLVAAGKLWLSCTVKGQKDNPNNPAFVGAMVLSPRQRKLEVVLESRKNAYVEQNDLIKKLLDKGFVRFAFRMTPQLVDFHLAEVSYRDQMFGVQMEFAGEFRFAIFKRAVLLRNDLSATGFVARSLNGGCGGFDLNGQAYLRLGYGGLLSDRGAMAYAFIEAGIRFRVSAWIEIGFSISIRICGKRFTKSWSIVFRTRVPELELTFRGHIAIADHGGFCGFDLQVSINVPICGYRLNVTAGWAVNADLYQEVRGQVAAFEAELEAAVKALDQSGTVSAVAPAALAMMAPMAALAAIEEESPAPPPAESWLMYSRQLEDEKSVALLMPAPNARWLTPKMATIKEITVSGNQATFVIGGSISGLPQGETKVRLVGLRAAKTEFAITVAKLNRSWKARIDHDTVTLFDSDVDPGNYHLLAGVWYVEETDPALSLSSQDQDTVPYFNEVERLAVRTSKEWLNIVEFDGSKVKTDNPHNITGEARVLLRNGSVVQDPGKSRSFDSTDLSNLTVTAKRIDDNHIELELLDLGDITPAVGWQLASAIEIAPPWSARNRIAALRENAWNIEQYGEHTGAAAAWAETAARAGDAEPVSANHGYAVVFDERYATADPRFLADNSPVEPGVTSTRFRPIDDVEAVGVDAVLEAARRYEQASFNVARQQLHEAFDLDKDDAILQARAQATQLLVHRLSDPGGLKPGDRLEAPLVDHEPGKVAYGWLCKTATDLLKRVDPAQPEVLYIRRAGGVAQPVALAFPKTSGTNAVVPELLPIRQDFVIDESSEVRERGRVIVRLPIRYPEEVLRNRPEDIGRLQVYRRIGDGPVELVFDQLRPDISRLDKKQVFSISRQRFVDDPAETQIKLREDFKLSATFDQTKTSITFDERQSRLLLPDPKSSADNLSNFSCRIDDNERRVKNAKLNGDGTLTLEFEPKIEKESGEITLELIADGLIVPRPVLISDEFAVNDRQFDLAQLRSAIGSGRAPQVSYSLKVLAEDDPGGPISDETKPWPTPVPLFVPKRRDPLPNLALAIPVSSLLESSDQGIAIQLIDLSEETPKLAERNGRLISADDFEFWLDGDILRQTGFYAGEAADPNPPREGDGSRVTLAAVNAKDGSESTAGKIPIGIGQVPGTSYFKLKDTRDSLDPKDQADLKLLPGTAFRAFFRAKGETAVRSLRRLPIFLIREFPRNWDSSVRYRVIDTAEIIPSTDLEEVKNGVATPILTDFSADDRYEAGRSAIRTVWPSLSLLDGGVELQFRDFDDSSMRSRTLVEVLEADEFAQSQTDFRDDTFWTPRPPDRVERYVSRAVAKADIPDSGKLKAVYRWNRMGNKIDVVRRLEKASHDLKPANDWKSNAEAVSKIQTALLSFEKSPLNLNRLATRQLIELLRLNLRAVVVGNKFEGTQSVQLRNERSAHQSLLELLTRIEQSRAETVSDTDPNDVAFLDRDTARKLAGIARRRIAIANEALALQNIGEVPKTASMRDQDHSGEKWARKTEWSEIYGDAISLAAQKPLPMTSELVNRFSESNDAVTNCLELIDQLKSNIERLDLEKLVPRAAGLSELLDKLDEKIRDSETDTPAGLLKRPHHELTTTRREDGEIVAREVPLRGLLPARARQAKLGEIPPLPDERLERLGIRAGHVATLDSKGTVAIWTTRGNSVRTEPMERVQYFETHATQPALAFALGEVAEGPRLLIAAKFGSQNNEVQLWDAGEARQLRKYGSALGTTFAATPRGLEVALVRETFKLTAIGIEELNRSNVPAAVTEKLEPLKGKEFANEEEFMDAVRKELTQGEFDTHKPTIANHVRRYQVELHTTEPTEAIDPEKPLPTPREKLVFGDGEKTQPLDGPVAYHDEIQVIAAARGNEILFWRDMGRQENRTPFLRFELGLSTAATHIQPVTLPCGAGFVVASTDPGKGLFFVDPLSRRHDPDRLPHKQPQPVVIDDGAIAVTQLAVDRRDAKATVVIDGTAQTHDLLQVEAPVKHTDASLIAVLHGRENGQDQSYLVLPKGGSVRVVPHGDDRPLQTLPAPAGFGAADAGEIVAIVCALQTGRMATAAGDPLSLFHLWERMGFALDIAAQDKTTRLFPIEKLRKNVGEVVSEMGPQIVINDQPHYVYLVEGKEPDAEFRDDRVGFCHVNVAVVPEAFLAACLEGNEAALEAWLSNRSIKLADAAEEKRVELMYLAHMTRLVGVPHPSRFGAKTGPSDSPGLPRGSELRLQPRSDRFVRVPASAGFSHWSWTLPDRKGHRMLVAARRVSRYEPLLRWWLNFHTRFNLAEEVALRKLGTDQNEHTVTAVSQDTLTLNARLEPASNWQPLRVEITSGTGVGQIREVMEIASDSATTTVTIDPGDPWLVSPVANSTKCRIMDAAPGWRLVVIEPIHDPARGEGARPLMVYQYPHSRKPRFSYQIPLDGMRATYNQISRVRTGYHGVEAAFRYFLPDRIDDPEAATLEELLGEIAASTDTPALPPRTVTNVAGGAEPDVRLFRHERMVSLPGLPFFYRYRLDIRSAYQARALEWDRSTAADRLPDDENASPSAQRLPASLGLNEMTLSPMVLTGKLPANQPTDKSKVRLFADGEFAGDLKLRVRATSSDEWIERKVTLWQAGVLKVDQPFEVQPAEGWEYDSTAADAFEAVLYLSANRDHLTREEARSEPNPVKVPVGASRTEVAARDLPDFFMDYYLYRNQKDGDGSLPSLGDLFSMMGGIRMPWSPNFGVPSGSPDEARKKPVVTVASGLKLVEMAGAGGPPKVAGQESSIVIEQVTINGTQYWRLRFWIANDPGQTILAKDKLFIQAARDGKITRAVKCVTPE